MYDKYKLALLKGNYNRTKAEYERIENQVEEIGNHILAEYPFFEEDEPAKRITDHNQDYLMSESDFTKYLALLYAEEQKAGIAHPDGMEYSAEGPAKQAYIDAEKALIQYGLDIIPAGMADTKYTLQEHIFSPKIRQGILDLVLRLA
jgi:hypothetical protein